MNSTCKELHLHFLSVIVARLKESGAKHTSLMKCVMK